VRVGGWRGYWVCGREGGAGGWRGQNGPPLPSRIFKSDVSSRNEIWAKIAIFRVWCAARGYYDDGREAGADRRRGRRGRVPLFQIFKSDVRARFEKLLTFVLRLFRRLFGSGDAGAAGI
jgi:hypothetical protein